MAIWARTLGAVATLLLAQSISANVVFQSTFDLSTEGWAAFSNGVGNPPLPVSWAAGAGNPGGALRHDAPSEGDISFFLAPGALISALHGAVGGSIAWQISTLRHTDDVFFTSAADIQIRGTGTDRIRLSLLPSTAPLSPTYQSLAVDFTTAALWQFFDGVTTTTATQAQIDDVISNAANLILRAEYWSGSLPDTTFLDNVVVSSIPEPASFALLGLSLVALKARRRRA